MDDPESQEQESGKQIWGRPRVLVPGIKRNKAKAQGFAKQWAKAQAHKMYGLLRRKIDAIRRNETERTIEISSVKFEGSVKKDIEEHCDFFDFGPLTTFLTDNFHLGFPADENGAVFRIDWPRKGKPTLGIHYLLAEVPPDKIVIYVIELFDPKSQSQSQATAEGVKREFKMLSKSGIITGIQELVKFGVKVLTGGA